MINPSNQVRLPIIILRVEKVIPSSLPLIPNTIVFTGPPEGTF